MNVETELRQVVEDRLAYLPEIQMGTDEDKIATESTAKLLQEYRENEKLEIERDQKERALEQEFELKKMQVENDKLKCYIDTGLKIAGGIAGAGLLIGGYLIGLKFEQTGTIASKAVTKVVDKFYRKFLL